jgi:AcrR family transcriptional regulator
VGVEDITRATGAAKGTICLYFASWGDMLSTVRDHIISSYADDIANADDRSARIATLHDLLRRWLRNEPGRPRRSPR